MFGKSVLPLISGEKKALSAHEACKKYNFNQWKERLHHLEAIPQTRWVNLVSQNGSRNTGDFKNSLASILNYTSFN